jgi:hypothetical protein
MTYSGDEPRTSFLKPAAIHGAYSSCISEAKDHLTIVMPWYTPSPQLRDEISGMLNRDIRFTLVTRPSSEAKSAEHDANIKELLSRQRRVKRKKLLGLMGTVEHDQIEVLLVENVHAKCVIQDEKCLVVSSSNLNVMSIGRNTEFGITSTESAAVRDARAAIDDLRHSERCVSTANGGLVICACGEWHLNPPRESCGTAAANEAARAATVHRETQAAAPPVVATSAAAVDPPVGTPPTSTETRGHCIRCGIEVPRDAAKPLCGRCYKSWARYKNADFEEKRCHACGEQNTTSVAKPLCRPCWTGAVR